ncbi:murein hydrolase activator EnvC family protein [Variovorax ureilyticus]|uniref:murein hydrolase activator EnvC family protein n=1 Tax=Variovorax ureilyticus TaxID=1836198 RepID=UPI003D674812
MKVHNLLFRAAAVMVATVSLVACTSTPLNQGPAPGFYPLPPAAGRPALPPAPAKTATFLRPASGRTISTFDGTRNKGIDIAGNMGDPIVASADGRVVYVGGELRGYGNMVIVKHNDTYLTAYAHAQTILVKENEVVRQGQKIAEIGNSGADRVKLHFEIRKQGVAVDPEPYLNGDLH